MAIEIDRPIDELRVVNAKICIPIPPSRDFKKAYYAMQNELHNTEMMYTGRLMFEKSKWHKRMAKEALEAIIDLNKRINAEIRSI